MYNDIKDSLEKNLTDRISSPFYGAFIISWLLWNWKIWYITFFIDTELLFKTQGILKENFIENLYRWDNFWHTTYSLSHLIIFPSISSYLIIFQLPKITHNFYVKYLDYEYKNKLIKLKKEEQFLKEKVLKLEAEEEVLEKEERVEKIKTKTQEEVWEKEYQDFKKSRYFQLFSQVKLSIYEYNGRTWIMRNGVKQNIVSLDLKSYLDANKIIEISKDENGNEVISLAEKGKYFMKKYIEEH